MTTPPVRTAISCSISLRRSPKPGALTATQVKVPRRRLTSRVGQGVAVHILGDDDQLLAVLDDLLEQRQDLLNGGDLLIGDQDVGIVDDGSILSVSVTI